MRRISRLTVEGARPSNLAKERADCSAARPLEISSRSDGSRPHIYEVAYEKAYTAMSFQRPSGQLADDLANGNIGRTQQADFPNTVLLAGGLPIVINDETVGGVGVAGLPGPQSEQCAQAGIDAVLN